MLSQDVRHVSVTRRYSVETAEHTLKVFFILDRYTILVFLPIKRYVNIPKGVEYRV